MKNLLKISILLFAIILIISSCGNTTKQNNKNETQKPSIQIPEGYIDESINSEDLYFLVKLDDFGDELSNITIIESNDEIFSTISNEQFIINQLGSASVDDWVKGNNELTSYEHIGSKEFKFNITGAVLMRQDSYAIQDIKIKSTLFQFIENGKLYTCTGISRNPDNDYFEDYVSVIETMKF